MNSQEKYEIDCVLPELEKLNDFFKYSITEKLPNATHGSFGQTSTFFGNVIQYCRFNIPASAMKLIYDHNKESIEYKIEKLRELKKKNEETK